MKRPRLFISYSQYPPEHAAMVEQMFTDLTANGTLEIHGDFEVTDPQGPPQGWTAWMREQLDKAKWVLVVCNPQYLQAWEKRHSGKSRGCTYEAALLMHELYAAGMVNQRLIPITLGKDGLESVPKELQDFSRYNLPMDMEALVGKILNVPWMDKLVAPRQSPRKSDIDSFLEQKPSDHATMLNHLSLMWFDLAEAMQFDSTRVSINQSILSDVVSSFDRQLRRYNEDHSINWADRHKTGGFLIHWICRLKPVQVLAGAGNEVEPREDEIIANELFAIKSGIDCLACSLDLSGEFGFFYSLIQRLRDQECPPQFLSSMLYLYERQRQVIDAK